jgi:hypothetical protein
MQQLMKYSTTVSSYQTEIRVKIKLKTNKKGKETQKKKPEHYFQATHSSRMQRVPAFYFSHLSIITSRTQTTFS